MPHTTKTTDEPTGELTLTKMVNRGYALPEHAAADNLESSPWIQVQSVEGGVKFILHNPEDNNSITLPTQTVARMLAGIRAANK